jgi:hypothetical protein
MQSAFEQQMKRGELDHDHEFTFFKDSFLEPVHRKTNSGLKPRPEESVRR